MLVDIKLYVYCISSQKEKKGKIEIFHINFENIFSPKILSDRLLDGSNTRRTWGVLTCCVRRALGDLATILLRIGIHISRLLTKKSFKMVTL